MHLDGATGGSENKQIVAAAVDNALDKMFSMGIGMMSP